MSYDPDRDRACVRCGFGPGAPVHCGGTTDAHAFRAATPERDPIPCHVHQFDTVVEWRPFQGGYQATRLACKTCTELRQVDW